MEARLDPATRSGTFRRAGEQFGINPETLRNWFAQAEIDGGHRAGTTTSDPEWLAELEKEARASYAGRTRSYVRPRHFRGGARPPTALIVKFINQHKQEFSVEPICRTLTAAGTQIAPSIYDASRPARPRSGRSGTRS